MPHIQPWSTSWLHDGCSGHMQATASRIDIIWLVGVSLPSQPKFRLIDRIDDSDHHIHKWPCRWLDASVSAAAIPFQPVHDISLTQKAVDMQCGR